MFVCSSNFFLHTCGGPHNFRGNMGEFLTSFEVSEERRVRKRRLFGPSTQIIQGNQQFGNRQLSSANAALCFWSERKMFC